MSFDLDSLTRCFEAAFPELPPEDIPEASIETVAAWDSLAALTLVALVEEQFEVAIPDETLTELSSFAAFAAFLREEHLLR